MEDATRLTRRFVRLGAALAWLAAAIPAAAAAADDASSSLSPSADALAAEARTAAGRDDHEAAIAAALAAIGREPARADELSVLLGHQLTWADRPAEAIPWYRRRLTAHPGDTEARLGLARAMSWTDDLDGARALYEAIAADEPRNLDAQLGIARMHEWGGDDRAAAIAYAGALGLDAASGEAMLGVARADNRRGRHRDAEALLLAFEEEAGATDATRTEVARARYWMGEADHGLETLDGVEGGGAPELRAAIRGERRLRLNAFASRWIDVDDQETVTFGVAAERPFAHGLTAVGEAARSIVDEPGFDALGAWRLTGGGAWRIDRRFMLNLRATAEHVGGDLADGDSLDAGAGETRLGRDVRGWRFRLDGWGTWNPRDWTRVDLGYGRGTVETPRARVRDVRLDVLSASLEQRLHDRFVARLHAARAVFSDDNVRTSFEAGGTAGPFRIIRRVVTHVDAGVSTLRFDDAFPDHGYYAPSTYDTIYGALRAEVEAGRGVSLGGEVRVSSEREEDADRFGVASGGAEIRWAASESLRASLFARKSTSRFDSSAGYGTRGVGATLSWTP